VTFTPATAQPAISVSSTRRPSVPAAPSAHRSPLAPAAPGGIGAGSAAGPGGSAGGWSGGPGALLVSFFALALCAGYRFLLAAAGFRSVALVSLVERPG
jgi:hypothetical protein